MNDTIYRQAAIDGADAIIKRDQSGNNDVVQAMIAWKEWIKGLSSAEPERKTSRWSNFSDDMYCLECGKALMDYFIFTEDGSIREQPNFCPNCGANMRSVQDGFRADKCVTAWGPLPAPLVW